MRHQYLWRKQASAAWWRANETELLARFTERIAIIERPGRKRSTVEICCIQSREAERLNRRFGGSFKRISRLPSLIRSKPLKIGVRLIITDKRIDSGFSSRRCLALPAEAAFGTGEHATTAMSLCLMEQLTRTWPAGWSLLDLGTGTGILALSGRVFGARTVTAIDNDPVAIATAKRNAIRNRIRGVRFEKADAVKMKTREKFDLIIANLFSELLIAALPNWKARLRPTGFLILSGVLRSQERELRRALRRSSFQIEKRRRRGKWIAFLAAVSHRRRLAI